LLIFDTERPGNTKQKQNLPWHLEEKSPRVSKAIKIMEKHIESPLPVESLAKFTGISQRQLERDFKEVLNTTVAKHYASLRIAAARRLVRETKLSVTEIAVRCGFNSIASLIRVYRQKYDCTPTEDRKRQCVNPKAQRAREAL
jgi:transcriptional regulator GlxA family with amidase domain